MAASRDLRDDDELLLATARGDPDAFGEFYRRHVGEVLGFLVRRTGSSELAADLAGETFAGALLACARYRAGGLSTSGSACFSALAAPLIVRRRFATSARMAVS